ncbi:MAG: hypothetical protein KJ638_07185, partial [Chloroflexi bacterium]|nr:hypothetical protein [Chloroflexota bacterium]
ISNLQSPISNLQSPISNLQSPISNLLLVLGALLTAAGLKVWLLLSDIVPFNSDEAVVALMARHITQGARPIFFYGQAYMGSLDAWLVAFGFGLFGEHVWVIRLIQGLLYLGLLVSTVKLGEIALGSKRAGIIAAWFLAVPSVIVTLYTTVSLGGYGEGLLLGNLILIVGLQIIKSIRHEQRVTNWLWLAWGFMVGLGVWVFGITLIFSIPMGIFLIVGLWQRARSIQKFLLASQTWKALGLTVAGGLLGSAPWWVFASQHGLNQLLWELGGGVIAGVGPSHWLARVWEHLWSLILFGGTAAFGMRPAWEVRWLALPLLPVALTFWVGVLAFIATRFKFGQRHRLGAGVLAGSMLTLALGFVFTSFGVDPSGRYFVPLAVPLALFAAEMILSLVDDHGRWLWGLIGIILLYNFWGTAQCANLYPPGLTTQFNAITQVDHRYMDDLIQFLSDHGETRGYTNYWVTYPLAFHSQEDLIFVPRLPYHDDFRYTPRDDRYAPYDDIVEQASRVAYITTNHPALNERMRVEFAAAGAAWQETQIGDYYVFYDLSQIVRPDEIEIYAP